MRRFKAYDPPEYVDWRPDPEVVAEFEQVWQSEPARAEIIRALSAEQKSALYAGLLRSRLHDIMLKRWVRQGVISKAWLGTGEEATTVGPVHALDRDKDVVAPMIRNAGACCEMGMSVADMLRGYLGTYDSPSKGRDGHVGGFEQRVLQPISNIGNMPPVVTGIALSFVMTGSDAVVLHWIGDGSVKSGPTHEALNLAAVLKLPAIFIIQNNQVALGTRVAQHHLPESFEELPEAYGAAGASFDGNNVLDAFAATAMAAERCRTGKGPVFLTAETFRMGGHATHDEAEAREVIPPDLYRRWGKRDPIGLYEEHLKVNGFSEEDLEAIEHEITQEVDAAADQALDSRANRLPPPESALDDVYASLSPRGQRHATR